MGEDDVASKPMKTAYELALERIEKQGIERPQMESLSDEKREEMAEVRRKAAARLAEAEILHRDEMAKTSDPDQRRHAEEEYRRRRHRIESDRERELSRIRGS